MNTTEEAFKKIMSQQTTMALATSVKDQPNVRIVNFVYDEVKKCVYFSTFKGNEKIQEIEKNPTIAFTTVPEENGTEHVRVHFGKARKSQLTIYDLAVAFSKKIPGYDQNIVEAGEMLDLYEIHFDEVIVILGMGKRKKIEI